MKYRHISKGDVMCFFCKGKLEKGRTDYVEKHNNHVILVRDVPCELCEQCGETYFNTAVMRGIEILFRKLQLVPSEISLTVVDYIKAVA